MDLLTANIKHLHLVLFIHVLYMYCMADTDYVHVSKPACRKTSDYISKNLYELWRTSQVIFTHDGGFYPIFLIVNVETDDLVAFLKQ